MTTLYEREMLRTGDDATLRMPVTEVRPKMVKVTITPETLMDYQSDFNTFTTFLKLSLNVDPAQMGQSGFQRLLLQNIRQNHPVIAKSGNLDGETTKLEKHWVVQYPYTHQKNLKALQEDMELVITSVIKKELFDIESFVLDNSHQLNLIKHFQTENFSIQITPPIIHWALQNTEVSDD